MFYRLAGFMRLISEFSLYSEDDAIDFSPETGRREDYRVFLYLDISCLISEFIVHIEDDAIGFLPETGRREDYRLSLNLNITISSDPAKIATLVAHLFIRGDLKGVL